MARSASSSAAARGDARPPGEAGADATALGFLLSCADAEVMERVRQILKMDAKSGKERLACLIVRHLNPAHVFNETQEAVMRGMDPETLRGMKARKEVPFVMGEPHPPPEVRQ